jgi:mRNA interferase HigB
MRLIGIPLLAEFAEQHPDAKRDLDAWQLEVKAASWATPHELKARYPKATIIGGRNVVFNIRHNRYRLHVIVDYPSQTVIVQRLGTHADYDRWTFNAG